MTAAKGPFNAERLNSIFKISAKSPGCVSSRESSVLEFKLTFGWRSVPAYAKTLAAFANCRGGYIVFGIANKPHKLIGLTADSKARFTAIDPADLTNTLSDYFEPEIVWEFSEHEINEKVFGLIYAHESKNKPIVCRKSVHRDLTEGGIYYRYRGTTRTIKYPELLTLVQERVKEEQREWMKHLNRIARIGVRDAVVFDMKSGSASSEGGAFIIDESLLSQLSFIKSGSFSKSSDKPVLKIVGELETVGSASPIVQQKQIVRTKGIRFADIVLAFLHQKRVGSPIEYVKQICFESSAFLPVYYFIRLSKKSVQEAVDELRPVISRSRAKAKLLERLERRREEFIPLPATDSQKAQTKRELVSMLLKREIAESVAPAELNGIAAAIRSLDRKQVKSLSGYLRRLLRVWFNKNYANVDGTLAGNLRSAICWVDEALYMPIPDSRCD